MVQSKSSVSAARAPFGHAAAPRWLHVEGVERQSQEAAFAAACPSRPGRPAHHSKRLHWRKSCRVDLAGVAIAAAQPTNRCHHSASSAAARSRHTAIIAAAGPRHKMENECAQRVASGFGVGATLGASIGACSRARRAVDDFCGRELTPAAPAGALYGTYEAFKYKVRPSPSRGAAPAAAQPGAVSHA